MKIKNEKKVINERLYEICKPDYLNKIPEERKCDISVCIWDENKQYKWAIAALRWNSREPCYEIQSVGMRLAEYGNTKLLKWLLNISEKYEQMNTEEQK